MEPAWMKDWHAEDVAKASLEQYERERHMMPSGRAVADSAPQGPTLRDVFIVQQRRIHAALLAEAHKTLDKYDHDRRDLIERLVAALEGR